MTKKRKAAKVTPVSKAKRKPKPAPEVVQPKLDESDFDGFGPYTPPAPPSPPSDDYRYWWDIGSRNGERE